MNKRKLVVFDFDGTLVDSHPHFCTGLEEFSSARNLPYDGRKMGIGYVDPLKYDLGWNLPLEEQPALLAELCAYMDHELLVKKRFVADLFDGVYEILLDIRSMFDLAIVTARDRKTTMATLEYHGLREFFPHYRSHCCVKERQYGLKPAPDALLCLINETGHDKRDVIMIGDTTSDILMANAAGVNSIAVLWGNHPQEKLATANPTIMIESVKELQQAVKSIFRNA